MSVLTTIAGIPVSSSLVNMVLNLQVSKAFEQSNTVIIGLVPFLRNWPATSWTSQEHWVVEVLALNPN